MLKRIIVLCTIMILTLNIFVLPVSAAPDDYDAVTVAKIMANTTINNLKAKGAVLMDASTGTVMFEYNSHARLPIASVTKVMTMLLVMEAIDSGKLSYEDIVTVTDHAYSMGGSQVWLVTGEKFPVKEMLKAVAVASANDCAVALAEKVAGSEDAFVSQMNNKAAELGMKDTNFLDCTGLTDEGHYSSANDIAIMSRELITKHPDITKYTTIWMDTFRTGQKAEIGLANTNKLLKHYDGTIGLKTGFTTKAGYCLSSVAKKNDLTLISVILGDPDSNTRFAEARELLDHGFTNFEKDQLNSKNEFVQEVKVKKGLETKVNGVYANDVELLLEKNSKSKITNEIKMDEEIIAPVKTGQKIGEVIYKLQDKEIAKVDVIAEADVQKASAWRLFFRMILEWLGLGKSK